MQGYRITDRGETEGIKEQVTPLKNTRQGIDMVKKAEQRKADTNPNQGNTKLPPLLFQAPKLGRAPAIFLQKNLPIY